MHTTFDLAHVGEGWHSYSGRKELDVGTSWQRFELTFTTGKRDVDEGARFEFNFGDVATTVVYVDDVRILEEPASHELERAGHVPRGRTDPRPDQVILDGG